MSALTNGKQEDAFMLKDGFLLYGSKPCVTQALREKVMQESYAPPYAGHRGIDTTIEDSKLSFIGLLYERV